MPTADLDGVTLYHERSGSGPPVLLIHASWGDHHEFDILRPLLEDHFEVVTYDRRGHGESQPADGQGSVHEDAADAAALLSSLGLGPAHVFATSYGACVGLRLAAAHPELVGSLWAHEPVLWDLLHGDPETEEALAEEEDGISRPVVELFEKGDWEGGTRLFLATAVFDTDLWDDLPQEFRGNFVRNAPNWLDETRDPDSSRIDAETLAGLPPFLVTDGDQSRRSFRLVVERLAAAAPQATRRTLAGVGHVPYASHPPLVLETLIERAGPA